MRVDHLLISLDAHDLFAISDVDTRALVSYIRENGAMNAVISTDVDDIEVLKNNLLKFHKWKVWNSPLKYPQKNLIILEMKMQPTR